MRLMMILFYICFITVVLSRLVFAEQFTLPIETDLKIIQGTSYRNGAIILRLTKLENENCKVQNLSFAIIPNPGNWSSLSIIHLDAETHRIPAENFCLNSTIGSNDATPPMESPCNVNPYGFGCNVDCTKNPEHFGCEEVPKCDETDGAGKTPVVSGCNGAALDCAKYPTAPNCLLALPNCNNISGTSETPGCPLDCAKYPGASACVPNCSDKPYLPGCNDCTYNIDAPGCNVCKQNSQEIWRCQFGYCDNNPDVPECRLTKDKIKILAFYGFNFYFGLDQNFFISAYYCDLLLNGDTCYNLNLDETIRDRGTFEKSCDSGKIVKNVYGKEIIYVCYRSKNKEIFWRIYEIEMSQLKGVGEGHIDSEYTFNSYLSNVFATENGGYCIVTSDININNSITIFATFIQRDSTGEIEIKGPLRIYWNNTVIRLRIYVCNIAYQSSGYSCIIQITNGNQVTYNEIDFFLSYDEVITKVTDLNLILSNNDVITDVLPLNFGGYFITTIDRITGNGNAFAIDNGGVNHGNWSQSPGEFLYASFILPNNTIVAIPKAASIFDDINRQKIPIISTDQFTNFSTVVGGDGTVPGGPGGYGSSKILSTTPSKNSIITTNQEFTITYNTPVIRSTGNFSVFQVNENYTVLKQTIPATNDQFVKFENASTIKLTVLPFALNKFNASYYIIVDHDFVKEPSGQNVIGIRENIWNFTTDSSASTNVETGGSASVNIRLTLEGSIYYLILDRQDGNKIFETLMEILLSRAISCDGTCLNITKYYQHDENSCEGSCSFITHSSIMKYLSQQQSMDNIFYSYLYDDTHKAYRYQIIVRVDISENGQSSSEQLAKDLNETITYKDINSLSLLNPDAIDASYGAPLTEKLWKKYWYLLPVALIVIFIIFIVSYFVKNGRNFFPIFLFVLILIDLALDIAFICLHKKDFVWIEAATLIFLILPPVLNLIFTFIIFKKEVEKKVKKGEWRKFFSIFSIGIVDIGTFLTVLSETRDETKDDNVLDKSSHKLSNDFSFVPSEFIEDRKKSILVASGAIILLEEIPQLIIYATYIKYHIKPAIVPIIVLSSCLMILVLKLIPNRILPYTFRTILLPFYYLWSCCQNF